MKIRPLVAAGALAGAALGSLAGVGVLTALSSTAGAATILHTSCPGQDKPVTVGASGFSCSSEGVVTANGHTATVRQTFSITGGGDMTVRFQIVGGPLDFPVALQWNSHAGLSNGPGNDHMATGTIPAGATERTISNVLLLCGGQQDIKAVPGGQETTRHISGSFRLAGPVATLAVCQRVPTPLPTTTVPTTTPSTVPSSTPGQTPTTTAAPRATPRLLPATL